MKNFTVVIVKLDRSSATVATTFKAATTKEARKQAFERFHGYCMADEQLVCATDSQYNEFWKDLVDRTNEKDTLEMMSDF